MPGAEVWMPLYTADFLADTTRLNTAQIGALVLLMVEQWRAGPLPKDERELAVIAKVDLRTWRSSIAPKLLPFFEEKQDCYILARLQAEREAANLRVAKRSEAGAKGAENRWKSRVSGEADDSIANGNGMANAFRRHRQNDATSPSPVPSPVHTTSPCDSPGDRFEAWFAEYPRHDAPHAARKAYDAAIKAGASHGELLIGLRQHRFSPDPGFIPYAGKWLAEGRWKSGGYVSTARERRVEGINAMSEMVTAYLDAGGMDAPRRGPPGPPGPEIDGELI